MEATTRNPTVEVPCYPPTSGAAGASLQRLGAEGLPLEANLSLGRRFLGTPSCAGGFDGDIPWHGPDHGPRYREVSSAPHETTAATAASIDDDHLVESDRIDDAEGVAGV